MNIKLSIKLKIWINYWCLYCLMFVWCLTLTLSSLRWWRCYFISFYDFFAKHVEKTKAFNEFLAIVDNDLGKGRLLQAVPTAEITISDSDVIYFLILLLSKFETHKKNWNFLQLVLLNVAVVKRDQIWQIATGILLVFFSWI